MLAGYQNSILWDYVRTILWGCVFLAVVAGWFFVKRLPALFRSFRAANWPMVQGDIESATVSAFAEQSLAHLGYSYRVEGERYSGYFVRQFADEQDAWDYIRPLKKQTIFIRYRPSNPGVSAVRTFDQNPLFARTQGNVVVRFLTHSIAHLLGVSDLHFPILFGVRNWPISRGRIESGTVTQQRERGFWFLVPSYVCEIGYSFAVRGEYYSGQFQRTFYREEAANELVRELKGKDVLVRYKPDSPDVSVLRRCDQDPSVLPEQPPQA
jgi:hypothetical protein